MKELFKKLFLGSKDSLLALTEQNIADGNKMFIVTANPEIFMKSETDDDVKNLLLDANTAVVPDGIGIVKGAKMLGLAAKERIPGVEITEELLKSANKNRNSIFLFGAEQYILKTLCEKIKTNYPSINIVGAFNGYDEDKDAVMGVAKKLSPDIILLALGVPAQEKLIFKHYKDFEKGIFMGVGGTFDVLSGIKTRAPKFFIKCNLEWLYRIAKEPSRIKRFYHNNIKFIFKVKKLAKYKK